MKMRPGLASLKKTCYAVPDDAALLARNNPIPSSEPGEQVDNCIFRGWLKNESSVSVALSGGCPFSDSFEVGLNLVWFFKASKVNTFSSQPLLVRYQGNHWHADQQWGP